MNDLVIADPVYIDRADAYLSIMTEYEALTKALIYMIKLPPSSRPVELVLVSLLSDS